MCGLSLQVLLPSAYPHIPASNFNTKFVHVSQNKVRESVPCWCGVVVVVVEIIKLYLVQTGHFLATTGYVARSPSLVQYNVSEIRMILCDRDYFVVVVVVVEIITLYLVQTGCFLAATSYVAPSPNHVKNNAQRSG